MRIPFGMTNTHSFRGGPGCRLRRAIVADAVSLKLHEYYDHCRPDAFGPL
jgi:hypothetical protein